MQVDNPRRWYYPNMAEANKYAAGEWKKHQAPEGLLRPVEHYRA